MDDIYKNIEEYNPNKKGQILIVFYYMIDNILLPIVVELFISEWKWNIYLVFVAQYYFVVPKNIKRIYKHYIFTKITSK